jgi:hypothetical protein
VKICRVETGLKPVWITGVKCDTGITPTWLRDGAGFTLVYHSLVFWGFFMVCFSSFTLVFYNSIHFV